MITWYIGIDNGVSGSIGWMNADASLSGVISMPTFKEQDYVKKKANVTRVDTDALATAFEKWFRIWSVDRRQPLPQPVCAKVFMERPMINPGRFKATVSAVRAWEATLIVLQRFEVSRVVVDSKQWQKVLLPAGCKGPELKAASVQVGVRLFPGFRTQIEKHGDADGLLIAEAARRGKW